MIALDVWDLEDPGVAPSEEAEILQNIPYGLYLQTEHWRNLRKSVLERDGRTCRHCGSGKHLRVHHITYARRGFEKLEDLITLCEDCHDKIHRRGKYQCKHEKPSKVVIYTTTMEFYWQCLNCPSHIFPREPTRREIKKKEQYELWMAGKGRKPCFA